MYGASSHRVVIAGGGFAGLYAAQSLRRAPVRATLIDRRNFHLFQPLLYQVATGGLSPADIASPLRSVLRSQRNVCVLQGEASGIDAAGRRLLLGDARIEYDTLIVATGASHHYFGHADWEPLAPGLKSIEDATEIRRRVFEAFERAERESDVARRQEWMTFAVVGGGPSLSYSMAVSLCEAGGLDTFDDGAFLAAFDVVTGVGRFDVDNIGQLALGMVGDADGGEIAFGADPFVGLGVLQIAREIHGLAPRVDFWM
jgi:hypothetical protein